MNNDDLLILRKLVFPRKDVCEKTGLYYRIIPHRDGIENSIYDEEQQVLTINHATAFDTYFNSLPLGKYQEYCKLSALFLRLRVCGFFVLRIYGVRHTDSGWQETLILRREIRAERKTNDMTELTDQLDRGYDTLYFTLEAKGGQLYAGDYLCRAPEVRRTRIAAVICTYRREPFLRRNLSAINRYLAGSKVLNETNLHIYVVDNGRTLPVGELNNRFVTVIPNDNTGGSGGFIRGYYEALHSGEDYTHILYMDDDIILDCDMLLRVFAILRIRRQEFEQLSVGGTMIRLSDRLTQHEAGAVWDGRKIHSIGQDIDMTERENVFSVSLYPEGNYHAWWFFCFPADWQQQYGYPLSLFVKVDDIEYSLRCASHIAVLSGIAVWHDDFEGKYDGFQEYYIKRNELILTSVRDQKPYTMFQLRKLIFSVMKQIAFQRYFLADIILRAYGDYLKGWESFYHTDPAALNQELMASCAPQLNDEELKALGVYFDEERYLLSRKEPTRLLRQMFTLNGCLLPSFCYPKDRDGFGMADLARCRFINFYKHKRVLSYDPVRHKGFVTEQKRRKLFGYCFRLIGMSVRFLVKYPSVRKGFRENLPRLTEGPDASLLNHH